VLPSSDGLAHPQTSLLDIKDSLELYIRAGVPLEKINLGIAWYGRSYRLADPGCVGYGCRIVAGGSPGRCTGECKLLFYSVFRSCLLVAEAMTPF
jgi:chitinase